MAFHRGTGLVYLPAKVGTHALHAPDQDWTYDPDGNNIGYDPDYEGALQDEIDALPAPRGELLAWDPVAGRAAWRASYPVVEGGGVLATAGNLVIQGRADGILEAYRASDGLPLWEFDAGTGIMAPPVTYLVDGVQYVSVLAGWGGPDGLYNDPKYGPVRPGHGRLLTFALGGTATLEVPPLRPQRPPMPTFAMEASPEMVAEGDRLFGEKCVWCHGRDAVAGPLPDLRYASPETHASFDAIVREGARASLGMPSFGGDLDADQVRAIQAYVLARARESAAGGG